MKALLQSKHSAATDAKAKMKISTEAKAYKEGQEAQQIGVPIDHNPYEASTSKYQHWEAGWEASNIAQQSPATPA